MRQKRHSTRLLVAAIMTLLTGSLAGASGLVLCRAANDHLAIEREHSATRCPTLTSSRVATGISVQSQSECIDASSAGTGPMAQTALDAARVPAPPVAFTVLIQMSTPRIEMRLSASADARAGPPDLAVHLRSTVLLV